MKGPFSFELIHQSRKSRARVGRIITPHGTIDTPNFVAVGTNATLKAIDTVTAQNLGLQLMFCNTYHLMLQPGVEVIKKAGGLHTFMGRDLPIITDSGGFQVFSLMYGSVRDELKSRGQKRGNGCVVSIDDDGVQFRSYRDGSLMKLTPELSVQAQKGLGADIIIPFDELPPYHTTQEYLKSSLDRTHRWQKRSFDEHLLAPNGQAMYAVIHGGVDSNLRAASCDYLSTMPFDGFSIGGSLGNTRQQMIDMLTVLMPRIPSDKPNHLLGIGDIPSIAHGVELGIDTFDSSHPTRCARHGLAFDYTGGVRLFNARNRDAFIPIDTECQCHTCIHHTRAYLHHLLNSHELAAYSLISIHNLYFMMHMMSQYRQRILNGDI